MRRALSTVRSYPDPMAAGCHGGVLISMQEAPKSVETSATQP